VVGNSWLETTNTSLSDPAKYHAFIWENGEMNDLNNLVQLPAGWILTRASAINDNGDIAGVGLANGITHGFLLINGTIAAPTPAPNNQSPVAVASDRVRTSGLQHNPTALNLCHA
jgi:probable HAF family extracellular repeat protein